MTLRLQPDETHLGYAPEREAWDNDFAASASWDDADETPEEND